MLEVKNLVKKFDKNVAVNNISFNVTERRIFGLLGRNGAGKSTIFRTILNIFKPDSGEILYNGKKINHNVTDKIGYLPEEGSLIPSYTVMEQFIYYGILKSMSEDEVKKQAIYWLERFNILDYANIKIKELSKGNRQKIQFIVAVLHNPELLILDEPFSGLDPVSVEEFKKMVIEQKEKGKVIIFSSHRMEHVEQLCDDILLIDKGREILKGDLHEIKAKYGNKELNEIFIEKVGATYEE